MGTRAARLDAVTVAAILLPLAPVFAIFREQLADPDLWWHLQAGRWIVEHGAVPWTDPFSSTAAGRPWIAYSWLPEVAGFLLVRSVGFHALILAAAAAAAALVAIVFLACRAGGAGPAASVLASASAACGTAGAWAERPQLLALVLLAALVALLQSPARARRSWLAPLLVALWANVHISFFVGVGLLGLRALCDRIDGDRDPRPWVAVVAAAAATLLTPYGVHLLGHLPTMIRQPAILRVIVEFQSPRFDEGAGVLFAASVLATVGVLWASRVRVALGDLVAVLGTLAAALAMARNLAIFAVVAAPVVARHLESLLPKRDPGPTPGALALVHHAIVAAALAAAVLAAPRAPGWRENVAPGAFPVAAADFVAAEHAGERLFNDFDWGGFLIFRLWPQTLVSIDGRTQVYPQDVWGRYLRTHFALGDWERFLRERDPQVVLWPAATPLAALLERSPQWRRAFADDVAVVFVRAGATPGRS